MAGTVVTRFVAGYRVVALFWLNLTLLFVAANLAAGAIFQIDAWTEQRATDPVSRKYQDRLLAAYPTMTLADMETMLMETWERTLVFEPFTQITERPIQGRFVNVDPMGFRHSVDQGPWPPKPDTLNVFLFGGSTAFSYGLPDQETVASHLQTALREAMGPNVDVYNFGRAWYYSTQERILFERLLSQGFVPGVAIFLDGLNDFYHHDDQPYLSELLDRAITDRRAPTSMSILNGLPLYELARRLARRVGLSPAAGDRLEPFGAGLDSDDGGRVDAVIARLDHNMKMVSAVAAAYDVDVWFALQPVPTYNYDLTYHLFGDGFGRHQLSATGYRELALRVAEGWGGDRLVWCGDIQQDVSRPLYVDQVHYSGEMAGMVAECVVNGIRQRDD